MWDWRNDSEAPWWAKLRRARRHIDEVHERIAALRISGAYSIQREPSAQPDSWAYPAQYVNRVTADTARPRLTATFALFLTSNPDVTISESLALGTWTHSASTALGCRRQHLFRSGEAAAFIVGAIVGALVENIIELSSDKFAPLKKLLANLKAASSSRSEGTRLTRIIVLALSYYLTAVLLVYYLMAILFLLWNAYFSFSDLTVHHPTIDWVQLAVFFSPLCILPITRFIFTANSPFPISLIERFLTR